jgi:ubiquinone/menaquinone biosynthesis C-methylase UbiE
VSGALGQYLSQQASRPRGLAGRALSRLWLWETARANTAALELLEAVPGEHVLEIGFGPGAAVARLAEQGVRVTGVEVSDLMVEEAKRRNARHTKAGVVHLLTGDGVHVPLPDNSVDAALSVHSVYFWPDPARTVTELARVLRPGGRAVLCFRSGEHAMPPRLDPAVYRLPTVAQATSWFTEAEFETTVAQKVERSLHVVCLEAHLPRSSSQ